ncbi:hypothetical protein GGI07_004448 [Coemansia sp. Benny D115]|nr:hypothetical protein GGI07_004448 [Coemansia sp. Benny D115]
MESWIQIGYKGVATIVSLITSALFPLFHLALHSTMSTYGSRIPQDLTAAQKKKELYKLYRRARYLDRKWAIGRRKPDGFTLLAIIPYVGDFMSTALAIGYMRRIHSTFVLTEQAESDMYANVIINVAISIIPYVGWIMRRIFGVNKRNYKILEKYVMGAETRSVPVVTEKKVAATEHKRNGPVVSSSPESLLSSANGTGD